MKEAALQSRCTDALRHSSDRHRAVTSILSLVLLDGYASHVPQQLLQVLLAHKVSIGQRHKLPSARRVSIAAPKTTPDTHVQRRVNWAPHRHTVFGRVVCSQVWHPDVQQTCVRKTREGAPRRAILLGVDGRHKDTGIHHQRRMQEGVVPST